MKSPYESSIQTIEAAAFALSNTFFRVYCVWYVCFYVNPRYLSTSSKVVHSDCQ